MMRYTYLLINFFTILVPFIFSFDSKMKFHTRWRYVMPGMIGTAVFFLIWDYFFTLRGIWSFNHRYTLGIDIAGMPVEEYLFFFTVPYACVFTYDSISFFRKKNAFPAGLKNLYLITGMILFITSFFERSHAYTFSVFALLGILLPVCSYLLSRENLDKFTIMYLISLLPMLIVNGLLTWLPVVQYDDRQNLHLRVGTIPVEDFLYSAILLLMNVTIYEWLMKKKFYPTRMGADL